MSCRFGLYPGPLLDVHDFAAIAMTPCDRSAMFSPLSFSSRMCCHVSSLGLPSIIIATPSCPLDTILPTHLPNRLFAPLHR